MRLKVIGTGSQGNCYIIGDEKECLIIDCGVKPNQVKKALNFKTKNVVGCLITHSHGDHSNYAEQMLNMGIDLFAQKETFDVLKLKQKHKLNEIKPRSAFTLDNFKIMPFEVAHDVPTLGFLINHPCFGNLVFITDTYYCRYKFNDVNHFVIEANYSEKIIDEKTKEGMKFLRDRVIQSHFSLENCIDYLKGNSLKKCRNVVLIHLSNENSNEAMFMSEIQKNTGCFTTVARNGITVNLENPF
jgi:phosphoribosyl 1,2-cyclic phosphodiesterase